ncbi:MAG TPA: alpha-ketoacid dehydrogenase subunit beta [Herpetosiphonaceae bacterium]
MAVINNVEAVRQALREELARDQRVMLLGQDIGVKGGVFLATEGLQAEFGADRVMDAPLAELAIAGVAIGAAMTGLIPVAEIQFVDYIWPAFDQLRNEAATIRYRTGGDWTVPLVVRAPYGAGVQGGLYHSQSGEAFFAHVPGLKVVAPATPYDTKGMLKAAIRDPDPVIFLEHKRAYRAIRGEVPDDDYVVPIGPADIKRPGGDLTVVTYGLMLHETLEAAQELAADGIELEIIDLRTIFPIDSATILESVRKTGKLLIVTEDTQTMSIASEVGMLVAEQAFEHLDAPIRRLTAPDIPGMPYNRPQELWVLPNAKKIAAAARELAAY